MPTQNGEPNGVRKTLHQRSPRVDIVGGTHSIRDPTHHTDEKGQRACGGDSGRGGHKPNPGLPHTLEGKHVQGATSRAEKKTKDHDGKDHDDADQSETTETEEECDTNTDAGNSRRSGDRAARTSRRRDTTGSPRKEGNAAARYLHKRTPQRRETRPTRTTGCQATYSTAPETRAHFGGPDKATRKPPAVATIIASNPSASHEESSGTNPCSARSGQAMPGDTWRRTPQWSRRRTKW